MDLRDILAALIRQWIVCVIGALVVALGAVGVVFLVPTTYQSSAQLVFMLPPQAGGPELVTNPYLNFDNNMGITASLVAASLTTQQAHKQVEDAGYPSEYSLALPPGVGPVLTLTATDTSAAEAVRTRNEVIRRSREQLAQMQEDADAPRSQTLTIREIAAPSSAEAVPGSKIRALALLAGLGGLLTLVVALLRDRSRGNRRPGGDDLDPLERLEPVRDNTSEDDSRGFARINAHFGRS